MRGSRKGRVRINSRKVRELRLARDLTQVDLATLLGISRSYLGMLEAEYKGMISLELATKLAGSLEVLLHDVTLEDGPQEQQSERELIETLKELTAAVNRLTDVLESR